LGEDCTRESLDVRGEKIAKYMTKNQPLTYLRVNSVDNDDAEVSVEERGIQAPNGVANLCWVASNFRAIV